ncbi:O-methylsterigmatocystin oxidoreductase [Hypsizygus marmoreus]|uniref:O-methylsterigmatocystin oxidoreductase n=1 Tax=Hypsizygus marmoreus TaxID=39966 RepID=A0A369KD35_HYPMA|nr:O-methylsterigmatocystin oxidoreductase [Hypsizygus marmoreus]
MSLDTTSTAVLLSCAAALVVAKVVKDRRRLPLPPGPTGLPFIGNALQMPVDHEWIKFAAWGKEYGGIVHVSVFGQPIIILNSITAINDLFEKRSGIYASRPTLPMAGELVGYDVSPPLIVSGNRHREYRKLMHVGLAPHKMESYSPIQEQKMKDFLHSLLTAPNRLSHNIRRVVAAVVFQISHGYEVKGDEDPLVVLADQATYEFSMASSPGSFFVDLLPILKYVPAWFPGAGFQKTAQAWRKNAMRLRDEPYYVVKDQVARGVAVPSFTSNLIEKNPNATKEEEDIYKWASTAFYSGGADTTVSAIHSFFLAMVLYPEVQKKAREEVDRVVGSNRLPGFKDREALPYIEAVVKEVLRWNPVAPLALPHKATQDDVYEGYHIPAGTILFGNTWGIFKNPDIYASPDDFIPERFLDKVANVPDPRSFAFGYGRRICPGQHLADASLYLAIVSTLSLFDITNAIDKTTGEPIVPVPKYSAGLINHPADFECLIKPRYSETETLAYLGK